MAGGRRYHYLWICFSALILLTLPSCPFYIERPQPIYPIKFLSGDEYVKDFKLKWIDRGITLDLSGFTGSELTQPVTLSLGIGIEFPNQADSIAVFPERIHCSFSGIPMEVHHIDGNERRDADFSRDIYFKCDLPKEFITNRSLIRNNIIVTLDGLIEHEGNAVAFDTVYAQMTHFDAMLKSADYSH